MARCSLGIVARREEGVLVRVLGLVVRRGFEPVAVTACMASDGKTIELEMTLEGHRPADTVVRQLQKLYDVEQVEVRP